MKATQEHIRRAPASGRAAPNPETSAVTDTESEKAGFTISPAALAMLAMHLKEIAVACCIIKDASVNSTDRELARIGRYCTDAHATIAGWRADACFDLIGMGSPEIRGQWEDWISSPEEGDIRERLAAEGGRQ